MAVWGRAHLVKASLLVVFLVVLLQFYNYRLDSSKSLQNPTIISMVHHSTFQWPKRTRNSHELTNAIHQPTITAEPFRVPKFGTPHYDLPATNSIQLNASEAALAIVVPADTRSAVNATFAATPHKSKQIHTNVAILDNKQETITTSERPNLMTKILSTLGLNACPPIPPNLEGPLTVQMTVPPLVELELLYGPHLLPGGWYRPTECSARDRVAIVIPYRDRADHLTIFLANLHPMLMRQQIEYGIFLVEQSSDVTFNRATLMNIGFVEALRLADWDCFIFHDIDLLPLDDRNLYTCPDQPRHMSVAVDTMGFKLPYFSLFGGVSALTVKQFRAVNGFSNAFWGWGGEDDDMSNRLSHAGFHIARYPINIARYTMLKHLKQKANPKRYEKLVNGPKNFDVDGLNSLRYQVQYMQKKILYTWIVVKIEPEAAR